MASFADVMTLFQNNTKIFFILIVVALLIALLYYLIEPTIETLMAAVGY